MLYKKDSYDLPFKVLGYYDLRHYDPVPGLEEERRQAFARSRLMMHEGTLVSGAEVPGFHHEDQITSDELRLERELERQKGQISGASEPERFPFAVEDDQCPF